MTTPAPRTGFTWHDGFLLGHAPIDEVHEEFVGLVGALLTASNNRLPGCLAEVEQHAQRHFDLEDQWMESTDFPARACHIDEHAAVLASIRGVQRRLAAGDLDAGRRLAEELQAWFPGHAQYLDSALAHWMCKLGTGGKPVVLRRRIEMVESFV